MRTEAHVHTAAVTAPATVTAPAGPADVGWTPTLHQKIDSAAVADREAARGAGAGRIP